MVYGDSTYINAMIVCVCNNVSDSQIRDAVTRGVSSMAQLQADLAVSTQCGTCFEFAFDVLQSCVVEAEAKSGLFYNAA